MAMSFGPGSENGGRLQVIPLEGSGDSWGVSLMSPGLYLREDRFCASLGARPGPAIAMGGLVRPK
jgi:hypothetical protein